MPAIKSQAPAPGSESETITADICVIGAGSGGLSVAAAAAAFGAGRAARAPQDGRRLPELRLRSLQGADRGGQDARTACARPPAFGIASVEPEIDCARVHDHVHGVIAAIAPNDSVERFTGLGVRVIQAAGRFVDKSTVVAGETRIKARRFVIATGSTPLVPPIPGLDSVPYFTNETIFDNQERLARPDRRRRRPDRHGAGAGAPPARLARHRDRGGEGAEQGRSRS